MDLAAVSVATFEPHVGDAFAIAVGPMRLDLVLESAAVAGEWPYGRQPFKLEFRGPADRSLAQATYRLTHATLGALEIFIVPVGRDASGTLYEAIFT